ncbi:transposase [Microbacterium sp. CIAB417]|uniref:transposase n=1 Tax=Microbacterium sp. CIAB417 TaxID=2860287 RepID=UPI001FACAEA7|nr:transposase [Microbacterium sp. CIAB417]
MAELDDIAAELYALPLGDFISERNARTKAAGDADLADALKSLRKPATAAWVVNLFARERPDQLAQALQLGEALREAQEELDAAALTALTRQRRALVRELTRTAADLAAHAGEKVTPATSTAVEQTLNAAMLDARAADAVASGRLLRALEPSGGDAVDVDDAVAGTLTRRAVRETPPDELEERRARKAAEQAVRTAEQKVKQAERALEAVRREDESAAVRLGGLRARASELAAELEKVQAEIAQAEKRTPTRAAAEAARDAAVAELDEARASADLAD